MPRRVDMKKTLCHVALLHSSCLIVSCSQCGIVVYQEVRDLVAVNRQLILSLSLNNTN